MDGYSRFVAFLKVILPLAALALLSTLFLLSRGVEMGSTIPFAGPDLVDRTRDQQLTHPVYTGSTKDGGEITVTASVASPAIGDKPAEARDLRVTITQPDGQTLKMQSNSGTLSEDLDLALFSGAVVLETDAGFKIETEELNASLVGVHAESPVAVQASGPPGTLEAGHMRLFEAPDTKDVHLLFNQGVKLVYDPKQTEAKP